MKTKLLLIFLFTIYLAQGQTTHNLNWERFANGSEMDITIDIGDTVLWTWTDAFPHTVENSVGNSVETFNSGTLSGIGQTFSYTFTVEGVNDYLCGIHGAGNMSGTITVVDNLGLEDFEENSFAISPNPGRDKLNLKLSKLNNNTTIEVFDVLGKKIYADKINTITKTVNVSQWNNGVYLVRLTTDAGTQTKRFVKQ
ncbi:T9SS type A sorting domain-containing protein [Flavobacteriaceae bacterium S0825]|uniref:T9SS type A sorting domain-containing protein n=1 Tax=Gaetbulibacter sp. S0825 TaxID=2720084 RepID=UPI00142F58AE|nr:T9SS type A sorting domain-containing protein [Gaetbulibacter sp. S0825]MCK0109322.1 T9SS type A sorting domain-containing protein [Flavobacteriaceae bacterium S0825]NIX64956.1 T9SS type A sorting domain-containing protein [Gaetbulibacter sp. S0825]